MEMFVFFTIPWIFVIALVVIALGIGVSALQFILDHIIIISIILGLPVAWLVWGTWKNENSSDEEKVECVLYPLFLVPAYAELIRLIVTVLNALDNDLWAIFLVSPYSAGNVFDNTCGVHGSCSGAGMAL